MNNLIIIYIYICIFTYQPQFPLHNFSYSHSHLPSLCHINSALCTERDKPPVGVSKAWQIKLWLKLRFFFIVFCFVFFLICLFVSSICFAVLRGSQVSQASLNFLDSHRRTELPVFLPSLPTVPIMSSLAEVGIEVSLLQRNQAFNKLSCFTSSKFSSLSITFITFQ